MKTYSIHLPLFIPISAKENFSLNLNIYRNAHFFKLNKAKEIFHEYIGKLFTNIPPLNRIMIVYTLFVGSKRRMDISNICSIVDKFFCDTLTENKIIPDDSYDVILQVNYRFGGIDKNNPRVEAIIIDLDSLTNEEEKSMRITLVESEINEALENYIRGSLAIKDTQELKISLKATRGDDGYMADIAIENRRDPLESILEPAKSGASLMAKEVFNSPTGTAIQIENLAQSNADEVARTAALVDKPEVTLPPTTEPVQSPSPASAEATQSTAVEQPSPPQSKSLFSHLTPPVHDAPKVA